MTGFFNQFKTIVLLALLTGLMLFVGSLFGKGGFIIALIFVLVMNVGAYWFSDKIALMMHGAKELPKNHYAHIYAMVKDVCKKADLPMPRLYLIESAQPNAFATGRDENHAAVAFTTGIITLLTDAELKGVIAHELSHVKNKDILVTTIAATIAGVISYAANLAMWGAFSGRDDDNRGGAIGLIVLIILAPLIALVLQLAISRSREYLADESGAATLRDSSGLANALLKLKKGVEHHQLRGASQATSSLFILNPFSGKGFFTLFSTHPPLEERVERLRKMKF